MSESASTVLRARIPSGFSGVVSISPGPGPAITEAWGLAYQPASVPNTPDTRFAIASGTKGFTATAILRLVLEGRLSLDDRVDEILPGRFPGFNPAITVRHLLTNTSGIGDYCDEETDCDFEAIWAERPVYAFLSPGDFAPLFANLPAKFLPGARFHYNNAGFIVLGMIIEAVTGVPYADAVARTVFEPFRMTDAGYFRSDRLPERCAVGYLPCPAEETPRSNIFAVPVIGGADGGAFVSAADMHAYWQSLFGPEADPRLRALLLETRVAVPRADRPGDNGRGYSLGHWIADDWGDSRFFFLIGADPGVSFLSGHAPSDGRTFAILSNSEEGLGLAMGPVLEIVRGLG